MLALLPLVLSLAPEIAKWLIGNKAEAVTQQAVEVVQAITGTSDPAEAARIAADPQKALELKVALAKIAADAQASQANERIETLKAEIGDVANARAQTVALAEAHSKISWAAPTISIVIVMGFFCVPFLSKYLGYSIDQIWLGALIASFANVGNYWLGSSASSKRAQEAVQTVAQQSANTVNTQAIEAGKNRRVTDQPPVVVVPPHPTPQPAPVPVIINPPMPVSPPAPAPIVSPEWRRSPFGGVRWQVTADGILIEGEAAVARSVGEPVTVRKVWTNYGSIISDVCGRLSVPVEVVVAVICTESKGNADAVLQEPDGRASGGLMQLLNTTAAEVLKRPINVNDLKDPTLNINAGVAYILSQKVKTNYFDPILCAAAYNSGGIYPPRSQDNNRFNLRTTGDHLERMIRWYGDACYVSKNDNWHSV
jgi:hypothetical protein